MDWNGRFGELLRVSFGSYLGTTLFFPFINALLGTYLIFSIFMLFLARLPRQTYFDNGVFLLILFVIMYHTTFGSIFLWTAGSFNYLWAYCLILSWLIPYRLFWDNYLKKYKKPYNTRITMCLGMFILGIFAGWSSEFGIVLVILHCVSCIYAFYAKIKLPAWYYYGIVGFTIGWIVLFVSPGSANRLKMSIESGATYSLKQLWEMTLWQKVIHINNIYKSYSLFFCLITSFVWCIWLVKQKYKNKIIIAILCIVMIFAIKELNNLIFLFLSVMGCFYGSLFFYKRQEILESKVFFIIGCLFFIYMLYIGILIQIEALSGRAQLHYNIIRMAMLITLFYYITLKFNIAKYITYILGIICILYACFILTAFIDKAFKWQRMVGYVEGQKLMGAKHVVVDKETFYSFYGGHGDWSNPGQDPNGWPNTTYADYFNVETFSVK